MLQEFQELSRVSRCSKRSGRGKQGGVQLKEVLSCQPLPELTAKSGLGLMGCEPLPQELRELLLGAAASSPAQRCKLQGDPQSH